MSSFHTKYRPKTLDEVIGQPETVRSLKRVIKDNRAHAFLFVGPAGTGKTTLARILASSFCGDVSSDVRAASALYEIDAASKSSVEDVREIVARSQYRAIGPNPNKFIILDEAHRLSAAAWSAFLKPVEEPPSHVYYAFCTTELGKIPKAIITRCLRYDLKPVKEDDLLELLIRVSDGEKLSVADDIVECIAENANGSPRLALVYLEACLSCKSANEARSIMRAAGNQKELIDLGRWLLSGKAQNWAEATKYLKALEGLEAESCRIQLVNYFGAALLNQKTNKGAANILAILECFKTPYNSSDKLAPLMYSVGLALKLDGGE